MAEPAKVVSADEYSFFLRMLERGDCIMYYTPSGNLRRGEVQYRETRKFPKSDLFVLKGLKTKKTTEQIGQILTRDGWVQKPEAEDVQGVLFG